MKHETDDIEASDLPDGWRIERHAQVGSTNDLAKQQARTGSSARLAIVADEQIAGRGRQGRVWTAPPRSSLLLSALLRPALAADAVFLLTIAASVALCEAAEQVAPLQAGLKWPNDLLLRGQDGRHRKAAGILTELGWERGALAWAVIGIGVNLRWSPAGLTDGRDLSVSATSLRDVAGADIRRGSLLSALLAGLDRRVAQAGAHPEQLMQDWRTRLVMLGQPVTVRLPDGALEGIAEDIDARGALLVRTADQRLHVVTAGDVEA